MFLTIHQVYQSVNYFEYRLLKENSPERSLLQSKFGVVPAADTVSLLLKRRSKAVVNIGFKPDDDQLKTSIMVVR